MPVRGIDPIRQLALLTAAVMAMSLIASDAAMALPRTAESAIPLPTPSPVRLGATDHAEAVAEDAVELPSRRPSEEAPAAVPLPIRAPKGDMDEVQAPLIAASPFELRVFMLTNRARRRGAVCGGVRKPPAPPLGWHDGLGRAARKWSRALSLTGTLSHDRMTQRVRAVGIRVCAKRRTWGENVAYNASADRVVAAWLRSPDHCRNIMNPRYGLLGVGMVRKGRRQYYTQLFHSAPGC